MEEGVSTCLSLSLSQEEEEEDGGGRFLLLAQGEEALSFLLVWVGGWVDGKEHVRRWC